MGTYVFGGGDEAGQEGEGQTCRIPFQETGLGPIRHSPCSIPAPHTIQPGLTNHNLLAQHSLGPYQAETASCHRSIVPSASGHWKGTGVCFCGGEGRVAVLMVASRSVQ